MTNQVNQAFEKWFSTLKVECRGNEPMVVLMTSWSTNAFHAGYQASTQASESEINLLKQRVAELSELLKDRQSDLDFEFNRAEQNELECNALIASNNQLREELEIALTSLEESQEKECRCDYTR